MRALAEIKAWNEAKSTKMTVDATMGEFQTARTTVATQAASGMDVFRSSLKQLVDMWKKVQTLVEDLLDRLKAMDLVMASI